MRAQWQKFESLEVHFPAKMKVTLCLLISAQIGNKCLSVVHFVPRFSHFCEFFSWFTIKMAPGAVLK